MTVKATWLDIRTQSMLRLGSPGLALMFPRPESGFRDRKEVATVASTRSPSFGRADVGEPSVEALRVGELPRLSGQVGRRVELVGEHHRIGRSKTGHLQEHTLHHRPGGLGAIAGLLEVRGDGVGTFRVLAVAGERRGVVPRVVVRTLRRAGLA